ncbi:MAG: uracil-DNA glycosylase [Bacteroidaceae bacterium]|nr:uracil-DNA glycosylase [Bacteroidaceae bacterium]
MQVRIHPSWRAVLQTEFDQPYFAELAAFVRQEYRTARCYPPARLLFNAFEQCPFDEVRAVILGQDPYHGPGQAEGLCFSVPDGMPHPPSLQNIFKEIESEYGTPVPVSGSLLRWAKQGVLLLNATLTVREGRAGSHQGRGWERFTDAVIKAISDHRDGIVFLLWGSYAGSKAALINADRHCILRSAHPSPLSAYRGFFGSHHFQLANDYLQKHGKRLIQW